MDRTNDLNVPPAYTIGGNIYCYDCAQVCCFAGKLLRVWDIEHGVTCENCDEEILHE